MLSWATGQADVAHAGRTGLRQTQVLRAAQAMLQVRSLKTDFFSARQSVTSLDELPQFFNVLQGRVRVVGPRPHAVAHNEMYRELIRAYMVRHKVKPGITGWAQVNGLRGETETIDTVKARAEGDLEYPHSWSLGLDLQIIVRTVRVAFFDRKAY